MAITLGPVMFLYLIPIALLAWCVTYGSRD
jgi:hypothetical protein